MISSTVKSIRKCLTPFWALSRTPHGLIDMTTPALAAVLCLGRLPSTDVILLGMVTAFAGYTAVYAFNDIVDYPTDKEKVRIGGYDDSENYLDGVLIRHPMAKGVLSWYKGLAWTFFWAGVAMAGAWMLNPMCLYIFVAGCSLEAVYCLLLSVTPMRVLANGVVKTCGAMAAVYAVNPSPSPLFTAALFLWIFFWEIGGQNIPADWTDLEEDRHFKAKTIPVTLGFKRAGALSMITLLAAMFMHMVVFVASPLRFGPFYFFTTLALNIYLLLLPGLCLYERRERQDAMALFNRASHYPLATLALVLVKLIQQAWV